MRAPVHTVVVAADRFARDLAPRWGARARAVMDAYAPDGRRWLSVLGLAAEEVADLETARSSARVHERVAAALATAPIGDLRLDFEDGYGERSDAEEDAHARAAAEEVAAAARDGTLPPGIGVRVKAFGPERRARAARTIEILVDGLVERGGPPGPLAVMIPKVTATDEVGALADLLDALEARRDLGPGSLRVELMLESPRTLFDGEGGLVLPRLVEAARGRCAGVHFGAYDYTASVGVPASHQHLGHPACDEARRLMQVALAGRGLVTSDGADNRLPREPHPWITADGDRPVLADARWQENRAALTAAWRRHAGHVHRALVEGLAQGWDLHPLQLPSRYGATFAFFEASRAAATRRLRALLDSPDANVPAGEIVDDAATGQALLDLLRRGRACGALETRDLEVAGLRPDEHERGTFAALHRQRQRVGGP